MFFFLPLMLVSLELKGFYGHMYVQGRIYHEANEAYVSGPFTCSGHLQGPGRGPK